MDKTNKRYRLLARIVLEATTPLAVGSGEKSILSDSLVAKDVNGLPYIPATSIAGVLRHLIGEENAKIFFGNPDKKAMTGSEIIFTEAKLLGKDGKPLDGLQVDLKDEFISQYFSLPIRQHNSINESGSVRDTGKFDEQIVYKGSRFCFEIEMVSDKEKNESFLEVLRKIYSDSFKLGSGTNCGFGELKVISCKTKSLNMDTPDDRAFYAKKSSDLSKDWEGDSPTIEKDDTKTTIVYELSLTPEDFFLFGSGYGDDDADMTPVKEKTVVWESGNPSFSNYQVLIPATSVKGAIAHRTAYYYNKKCKYFVGDDRAKAGIENIAVRELFGYADNDGESKKGNVSISDVFMAKGIRDKVVPHVAIDRFTGGALDGALFAEKVTYAQGTAINLIVTCIDGEYSDNVLLALEQSLQDVCKGLLPLGGGVNRGNGAFKGELYKNGEKIYGA